MQEIAPVSLLHCKEMIGPYGLYQHATIRAPLLREGYCTDDNARGVQVLLRLRATASPQQQEMIDGLLVPMWRFLKEAEEKPGIFFNFRRADGTWLNPDRSDDMYARVFRALITILTIDVDQQRRVEAREMLVRLQSTLSALHAPRAWAEIAIAASEAPEAVRKEFNLEPLIQTSVEKLLDLWRSQADELWPWFEPQMTYANALLPHALAGALPFTSNGDVATILKRSAQFLVDTTILSGVFTPIGSRGWYPKGGTPSRDNQQAIEAGTMFDFLLQYQAIFPDQLSLEVIAAPYLWFFGKNTGDIVLANREIGACLDGLFIDGPNPNHGAESMLAYLWSEALLQTAPQLIRSYIIKKLAA